jgi:hypothetical protein
MMMITRLFDQLGLWAPSSEARHIFTQFLVIASQIVDDFYAIVQDKWEVKPEYKHAAPVFGEAGEEEQGNKKPKL